MAGINLHPIKSAAMHGDHGALDINQIVLAQIRCPLKLLSITGEGGFGPKTSRSAVFWGTPGQLRR
jgi:hypothetical protein